MSTLLTVGWPSRNPTHPGATPDTVLGVKIRQDVAEYVAACTVCMAAKPDNRPPAGLLQPLPIPRRPWTHISLDFITGLPPSQGNTAILVVVDRFSKAARFIALAKLCDIMDPLKIW